MGFNYVKHRKRDNEVGADGNSNALQSVDMSKMQGPRIPPLVGYKADTEKLAEQIQNTTQPSQKKSALQNYLGWGDYIGKQMLAGLSDASVGISGLMDSAVKGMENKWTGQIYGPVSIIPQTAKKLGVPLSKYTEKLHNSNKATKELYSKQAQEAADTPVKQFLAPTFRSLPDTAATVATALATGGSSAAAGMADDLARYGMGTAQKIGNALKIKPYMYPSAVFHFGQEYVGAKDEGANDAQAILKAAYSTYPNILIEQGSGVEALANSPVKNNWKDKLLDWVKSGVEEGGEEFLQYPFGALSKKLTYAPNTPIYSTNGEAVINPKEMGMAAAQGTTGGLLLGAATTGAKSAVNAAGKEYLTRSIGKGVKSENLTDTLIAAGMESPEGSQARILAEQLQNQRNNGTSPSNRKLGKLFTDSMQQLIEQNQATDTDSDIVQAYRSANNNTLAQSADIDADGHTPQMRQIMQEYADAVDGDLINFAEYAKKNPTDNKTTYTMSEVSPRAAEDIKNLTGIDVEGFDHSIKTNSIRHIEQRHGMNGESDTSMADVRDIARIQYVIDNYDKVEFSDRTSREYKNSDNSPAKHILYTKRVNGNYYVVEAVPDTKKHQLAIVTAYKNKAADVLDAKAPSRTSKNEHPSALDTAKRGATAPNNSAMPDTSQNAPTTVSVDPTIPQNGGEVNTNIRENLQNDTSQDVQRAANMDESTWVKPDNVNENAKYTPLHEIRDFIQDKFHVRIDTGKIQQKNALGIFKVKSENIRTLTSNDVESISHELGHALDKKYNFRDMASIDEAAALLSEGFKKNYKESEYGGEAAAEFLRIMLWDKTFAQNQSPNFYNEFMAKLDKADSQNIEKLADMVNGYFTGDVDTSSAIVSKLDMKNNDGLLSNADKVYTNWLDDMHPIKKFEEYSGASDTEAYRLAINSKNVNAVVNNAITGKLADYDGNIVGDSLKDVMSAIKPEEVNAFSDYLINKHAPSWIEKGRTVYADPRANNVEYLNKKVQDFEQKYPHFKETSERLYQFNRQVGQAWLVDTGLISQELWDKIHEMYPFYIPLNRAVSNNTGGKAKSGFANQSSGIRGVNKGSGKEVINPIENIMMNTDRMIRAGTRNKVMQSIARIADSVDGMGWLMEQVAPDQVPRSVQVADYKEQLADAIAAESRRSGGAAEFEDAITDLIDSILPDTVTEFSPAQVQKNGIVSVMKDGKAQYYKVYDADLYNALTAMGSLTQQVLPKIAKVTRAFTSLTTGSNPLFTIGSNIWRDYQTAYINNKTTYNPVKFFTDYITTILHDMRTNSPEYQQFKALGGGESSMLSNVNDYKALLRELNVPREISKAEKVFQPTKSLLQTIVKASDIVETAPRFAEFKRTLKQTGDTQQAIYNAKEVTTNFARGGKKAKAVNAFTPFFNASLQGTDLLLRRVKEAPVQTLTKMFVGTVIPSLITWAWNHRDEETKKEYNALSTYQKNSFYNFNIGGRTFFKIPKAEGNGLIASLTERILDQAAGGNGEAFDDFAGYVLNQIMPPLVPTDSIGNLIDRVTGLPSREVKLEDFGDGFRDIIGIGTLMGLGSNSDFKGTPIVPAYMEDYAQKDQYDESTSYVAKWIGQHTGTSPKKIDYVINSNFGYLGALNKSFAPNKTIKDFMGIAGKFSANSAYSTNIFNNFYEEAAQAGRDANSNPNDKDVALKSKQYDNFKSYVSKTNGLIKKEIFPKRQETLKAQLRDEVQQFREGLPSLPDNAVRVYKETGESSVLPLANLDSVIKETKGKGANKTTTEHTLTTEQYKEYVRTYQQYVGEEYGKVNLAGKISDTQVKNLKSANEVAKEKAKQYMLDKHFK